MGFALCKSCSVRPQAHFGEYNEYRHLDGQFSVNIVPQDYISSTKIIGEGQIACFIVHYLQ